MKEDYLIIKSSDNTAEFQFSERENLFRNDGSEFYCVTLKTVDMSASSKVYAFDPSGDSCCNYFADLANSWRGWNGVKYWNSLEGEFKISSESDSLGHITMEITLESYGSWKAHIIIVFDSGQLEEISSKIKTFFTR